MIWITADHHYGHSNIIKYTNRPFSTVEEMDNELIARWNSCVQPDDMVYHLGDFTLGSDIAKYVRRLNGRIAILGTYWHHDCRWLARVLNDVHNFRDVLPIHSATNHPIHILPPLFVAQPSVLKGHPIVMCHYPMARWERSHYGAWMLHGHCHGRYKGDRFIYDVGVDNNNFYPVSLGAIERIMRGKGWTENYTNVTQ